MIAITASCAKNNHVNTGFKNFCSDSKKIGVSAFAGLYGGSDFLWTTKLHNFLRSIVLASLGAFITFFVFQCFIYEKNEVFFCQWRNYVMFTWKYKNIVYNIMKVWKLYYESYWNHLILRSGTYGFLFWLAQLYCWVRRSKVWKKRMFHFSQFLIMKEISILLMNSQLYFEVGNHPKIPHPDHMGIDLCQNKLSLQKSCGHFVIR